MKIESNTLITVVSGEKVNCDQYTFEYYSGLSTKEYFIYVDFQNKEITGDCIRFGTWDDLYLDECLEMLEAIKKEGQILRDYQSILNKLKLKEVVNENK